MEHVINADVVFGLRPINLLMYMGNNKWYVEIVGGTHIVNLKENKRRNRNERLY